MRLRHYILTLIFLALAANVFSQEDGLSVIQGSRGDQSEKLSALTDELDFDKTKEVWKFKEREKDELNEQESDAVKQYADSPSFGLNSSFTNILAYIMIVLLIAVVIYLVFSNVKIDKKIKNPEISILDIEDIEEVDAASGFKQAINVSDYRSAIRMQFIKVLQMLQEGNHIHWRPEKTNRDYLRELSGTRFKKDFRELSGIYELVWYGNTQIDKDIFAQLNPSFDQFINRGNEQ